MVIVEMHEICYHSVFNVFLTVFVFFKKRVTIWKKVLQIYSVLWVKEYEWEK